MPDEEDDGKTIPAGELQALFDKHPDGIPVSVLAEWGERMEERGYFYLPKGPFPQKEADE